MRPARCLIGVALAVALMLIGGLAARAAGDVLPTAVGGFVSDGGAVSDPAQSSGAPALAIRRNSYITYERWLAFAQSGQVVVAITDGTSNTWARRGNALNFGASHPAGQPSIDFAGADRDTPWVAFAETINGKQQILAARFDGAAWQLAGQLVDNLPTLNRNPKSNAAHPALAAGWIESGADPIPWVAWDEEDADGLHRVVVSYGQEQDRGETRWQPAGDPIVLDPRRNATRPDLVFSGPENSVAWVAWQEEGGGQIGRIYAARIYSPSLEVGGFGWMAVGSQGDCATQAVTCALNRNAGNSAGQVRIASGILPREAISIPWVVFSEQANDGIRDIHVLRLDPSGKHFQAVGPSVNRQCLGRRDLKAEGGANPDIFFVGKVPHVAWTERQGGSNRIFVCHLLDARPGQEIWDLTTDTTGLNRERTRSADNATLASDGQTAYVAWEEGTGSTQLFAALRYPTGPAWGATYPPYVRCIGNPQRAAALEGICRDPVAAAGVLAVEQEETVFRDQVIGITTSCNHADGWRQIAEIQFALYDAQSGDRIFLGRYLAADDPTQGAILVEDPDHPGAFLGPAPIGSDMDIETSKLILGVSAMAAVSRGPDSPALDVDWVFKFKTAGDYVEAINIVYREEAVASSPAQAATAATAPHQTISETGLFRVGDFAVLERALLPLISR
ncbi:MAG: hypothetical protein KJZ93_06270 [Caldilineaceae bacterium]|nr:hypothetical protein [Caldilineaceae bacterium]